MEAPLRGTSSLTAYHQLAGRNKRATLHLTEVDTGRDLMALTVKPVPGLTVTTGRDLSLIHISEPTRPTT